MKVNNTETLAETSCISVKTSAGAKYIITELDSRAILVHSFSGPLSMQLKSSSAVEIDVVPDGDQSNDMTLAESFKLTLASYNDLPESKKRELERIIEATRRDKEQLAARRGL